MTDLSDPLVIATFVLAGLTGYYAMETYRIRRNTERPSFSFGSMGFTVGGKLMNLHIINTGQTASDVRIDCYWAGGSKKYYVMSLGSNGLVILPPSEVPVMEITDNGEKIKCKDIRRKRFSSIIEMDFGIMKKEDREQLFQYRPTSSENDFEV